MIRTYAKARPRFRATILRYFNVYGCDPAGRLCEFPRPELGKHGRISTACFDAALGRRPSLAIFGTDFPTSDGTPSTTTRFVLEQYEGLRHTLVWQVAPCGTTST